MSPNRICEPSPPRNTIAGATTLGTDAFQRQLDQAIEAISQQRYLRKQLRESEEAVHELQNHLSKIQELLHTERGRVLCLYAENDRLKLRELVDRRRIDYLSRLTDRPPADVGTTPQPLQGTVEWTATGTIFQRKPVEVHTDASNFYRDKELIEITSNSNHEFETWDLECTQRALFALQKQLDEQTRTSGSRIQNLMADQERRIKGYEEQMDKLKAREVELLDQLKHCEFILQEVAHEYLHLRLQNRLSEKTSNAEKEHILTQTNFTDCLSSNPSAQNAKAKCPGALGAWKKCFFEDFNGESQDGTRRRNLELRKAIEKLEFYFDQQCQITSHYREQIQEMKESSQRILEESNNSNKNFTEKLRKLKERSQLYARRCEDLERRRKLDVEGYRTEIDGLKKRLAETEALLRQVSQVSEADTTWMKNPNNSHTWMPRQLRKHAARGNNLAEEIKKLKHLLFTLNEEFC